MGWFLNCCITGYDFMQIILTLVFVLFSTLSFNTYADVPASLKYKWSDTTPERTTLSAACNDALSDYQGRTLTYQSDFKLVSVNTESCTLNYLNTAGSTPHRDTMDVYPLITYYCIPPATPTSIVNGHTATCSGAPPPSCADKLGQTLDSGTYSDDDGNGKPTPIACFSTCQGIWSGSNTPVVQCGTTGGASSLGQCVYAFSGKYLGDGTSCSADSLPAKLPPKPTPCPVCDCLESGKSWGTVNGAVVCVPKGSAGSNPVSSQDPPVVKTETPAATPENPNPTPVTTVTPSPVVTVSPPPAGSPSSSTPVISSVQPNADGSTTQTDQSLNTYCEKNPNSATCKAKSECEGDPDTASCKFLCEKYPDISACKTLEETIGKVSDIPHDGDLTEHTIDAPSYSQINVPSSNTCPPPRTISIYGTTMTVSFQWLCDYASPFRKLVIAFALYGALLIVVSSVKGDSQPYQRGLF